MSVRVVRKILHRLVIFLSGTIKKCWKRPVLPIRRVGCRFFRHEKVAEGRPSARLGAFSEITKKTGASVRVMREMSHRLVIFLSGTIKKCWKRPVLPIRRTERVSSVTKKWLKHALASALVHRPRSQKESGVCARDA